MRTIWSDLTREVQDSIIDRVIYKNEDCDTVALEYNLKPSSLSRTIRKIKRRRGLVTIQPKKENLPTPQPFIQIQEQVSDEFHIKHFRAATNRISAIHQHDLTIHINGWSGDMPHNPNERMIYINSDEPMRILLFTDAHFPFHDPGAVDCFLRAAEKLPHEIIINGGDTLDMYGLSQYGKDPTLTFTKNLKVEIQTWKTFARDLNIVSPHSEKFSIFGNHMMRYINWLHNNQTVLMMDEMQIDNLMKMKQLGWHPNVADIYINGNYADLDFPNPEIIFHHGTLARKHAGNSSRGESENMGYVSSVSGHIHRLSVAYKKTLQRQVLMAEGGTLRNLLPEYMHRPDWQNGFLYITHIPGGATYCQPILIHNGNAYYEGRKI